MVDQAPAVFGDTSKEQEYYDQRDDYEEEGWFDGDLVCLVGGTVLLDSFDSCDYCCDGERTKQKPPPDLQVTQEENDDRQGQIDKSHREECASCDSDLGILKLGTRRKCISSPHVCYYNT